MSADPKNPAAKKVIKVEREGDNGGTQVVIDAPAFQNFGENLDRLEEQSLDAWDADPNTPEIMQQAMDQLRQFTDTSLNSLRQKAATEPSSLQKEQLETALKMMEQFFGPGGELAQSDD